MSLSLLEPGNDYVINIEHLSGGGQTDIFGLIVFDESFNTITVNAFNPPAGDINDVALDDGGAKFDGALYVILDDGAGGWIAPTGPIGYDLSTDGTLWELDSGNSGPSVDFTLNLSLVDLDLFFGAVTTLDISGNFESGNSNNEDNTIFLTANDVLEMTDGMTILGDAPGNNSLGETVNLVDPDGGDAFAWQNINDLGGGDDQGVFDTWAFTDGSTTIASLLIEDSITVIDNVASV